MNPFDPPDSLVMLSHRVAIETGIDVPPWGLQLLVDLPVVNVHVAEDSPETTGTADD